MTDSSQKLQPLPTSVKGVLANHLEPLDYATAFALTTITAPWVGGPTVSAVWDLLSNKANAITLTADTKIELPINIERVAGTVFFLDLIQDATGGRKVHWGSPFDWDDAGEPILNQGPGARNIFSFYCTGSQMFGKLFYRTPVDQATVSTI